MPVRNAPLLVSLLLLSACRLTLPDHTDTRGAPPPAHEEITWETFFQEPWRDPLQDKYEELFREPFPNRPRRHFETTRPFSDVEKYDLAFEAAAIPGARKEIESGGGAHAVALHLPDSAGKRLEVRTEDQNVILSVERPLPERRYRVNRPEETVVPVPAGADPATARVTRDGDWVRIQFKSKNENPGRPHAK